MNFVPRPVMKSHSSHEDSRPLPGYESNKRGKWDRLHRRLAHSQPYLLVFTTSDRFIAEYLGVMLVMHKSVTLVASEATASSLVERGTMEVMGCPRGARETDGPSSEDSRRPSCREILPPRVRRFSLPPGPAFSITWGPMRVVRCFRESAERGSSSSGFRPAAG